MPLLGGLFNKKNKSSARSVHDGASAVPSNSVASDFDSALSSPTTSFVTPDKSVPSSPNGKNMLQSDSPRIPAKTNNVYSSPISEQASRSTSKLRFHFGRKKSAVASTVSTAATSVNLTDTPRPAYTDRVSTSPTPDTDVIDPRRLRPPPSKSAIFAAYGDPSNALSTRSLPNDASPSYLAMQVPPTTPPVPPKEKRPSLFSWARSSSFKPTSPSTHRPTPASPNSVDASFNLKSFRHVGPPSPNASSSSLVVPPARPRGLSTNSDSSQRISVAAFREAQARRSTAGSPVPSFRTPSPAPLLPSSSSQGHGLSSPVSPADEQRGRASPRPPPGSAHAHSPPRIRNSNFLQQQQRRVRSSSIAAVGYTSESDESTSSEEEEESDDDGVHRKGTITQKTATGKRQTKSEIGHGTSSAYSHDYYNPAPLNTRSRTVQGLSDITGPARQNVTPSNRELSSGQYGARPRASASTSALSPSAAAKRASVLANANASFKQDPLAEIRQVTRHVRDSSTYSNPSQAIGNSVTSDSDSSDEDDDNAPLATLVPPRRPGSAMSSNSNSSLRPRTAPKPLLDINEITSKKPTVGTYKNNNDGFTKGGLLSGQVSSQPLSDAVSKSGSSPTAESPVVTSKTPPPNFAHFFPPSSPPKEIRALEEVESKALSRGSQPTSPLQELPNKKETSPERKRDMLTERLVRVVKGRGRSDSAGAEAVIGKSNSTSPPPPHPPASFLSTPSLSQPTPPIVRPPAKREEKPTLFGMNDGALDDELMRDVDDSILRLISRGNSESETSEDDENVYGKEEEKDENAKKAVQLQEKEKQDREGDNTSLTVDEEAERQPSPNRIAPIPIRHRAPPPSFSVMSRPPLQKPDIVSSTASSASGGSGINVVNGSSSRVNGGRAAEERNGGRSERSSIVTETSISSSTARPRSSTLIPSPSTLSPSFGTSTSSFAKLSSREGSSIASSTTNSSSNSNVNSPRNGVKAERVTSPRTAASNNSSLGPLQTRQRSSTLGSAMATGPIQNKMPSMPVKPFAVRRDSPASSTGDSSSGRAPITPRDGSDIVPSISSNASGKKDEWSSGVSGLGAASAKGVGRHAKKRSVSFDQNAEEDAMVKSKEAGSDPEARRRERRRSEAKAAIELGNVINGPGPVVSDDEDDLPINQALGARMSTMNPMMGNSVHMSMQMQMQMPFNASTPSAWGNVPGWPQQPGASQFLMPPPADPNLMAAHQQAMLYARQAYQMAVAQQAMAAAADEWDRRSVMGGSVYGGASNASVMIGPPYGMMGAQPGNGWSTGSMIFPNSPQSVYGGLSSSRSEYGVNMGGGGAMGNWSSARSTYGESFGPSDRMKVGTGMGGARSSGYFQPPPVPPIPQSTSNIHPPSSSNAKARNRTASQPAPPNRGKKAPPPSSWKAGI